MSRRASLALLVLLALAGCEKPLASDPPSEAQAHGHEAEGGHESEGEHDEGVTMTPEAAKTAGLVVEPVRRGSMPASLSVPGVVGSAPGGRAVVTPPVGGRVARLLAVPGDRIRKGQPLAIVESGELAERTVAITEARRGWQAAQAETTRAASELALAQGRRRSAERALRRQRELARAGAFSQPSLQAAERALNDARSALESARREAVVHQAQLERSERLYRQELVSRIELENARLDVEKDRIAQERAQREIEIARAAYERERSIGNRGLLNARETGAAVAEAEAARLEADKAAVGLRAARAAEAGARTALADAQAAYAFLKGSGNLAQGGLLTVVAPLAGRVVHREATVGQAVERTTELFEIDDLRTVVVTAQVPERQIGAVRRGARATVETDTYPGRRFVGTVDVVGGRLDPKTRTLPVTIVVPNGDGALRPEMFADVELGGGSPSSALTVPVDATFAEEGRSFVFVEEPPGRYVRRAVQTGREGEGRVEIVAGLREGTRVVTTGAFALRSQARKDELKGHED